MKHHSKLKAEQEQARALGAEQALDKTGAMEFATPEELLRYDAAHVTVPPKIGEKLRDSTAGLPVPKIPWWKRWFNRDSP